MQKTQNQKLKYELKAIIKPWDEELNDFAHYLIIYDFLDYVDKNSKLEKIMKPVEKESQKLQKSVSIQNGLFLLFENNVPEDFKNLDFLSNVSLCYLLLNIVRKSLNDFSKKDAKIEKRLDKTIKGVKAKNIFKIALKNLIGHISDQLDKGDFLSLKRKNQTTEEAIYFNEEKSLLNVLGYKILIAERDKITNGHKLFKYIFIDNASPSPSLTISNHYRP